MIQLYLSTHNRFIQLVSVVCLELAVCIESSDSNLNKRLTNRKNVLYFAGAKGLKMNKKERYQLNVQDLMDSVSESTVTKQLDVLIDEDDDKVLSRSIRWVVSDYVVYSGTRDVYSIGFDNSEIFKFVLKRADYKKFVSACQARRQELFGKKPRTK